MPQYVEARSRNCDSIQFQWPVSIVFQVLGDNFGTTHSLLFCPVCARWVAGLAAALNFLSLQSSLVHTAAPVVLHRDKLG